MASAVCHNLLVICGTAPGEIELCGMGRWVLRGQAEPDLTVEYLGADMEVWVQESMGLSVSCGVFMPVAPESQYIANKSGMYIRFRVHVCAVT